LAVLTVNKSGLPAFGRGCALQPGGGSFRRGGGGVGRGWLSRAVG